jgi:cell division protease FtsH
VFLGRDYGQMINYSDEVAGRIDAEVRALIDNAHRQAEAILRTHRDTLDRLAERLVEKETLDQAELAELLGGLPDWATPPAAQAPPVPTGPVEPPPPTPGATTPVPVRVPAGAGLRRLLRRSPSKPATA